MGKIVDVHVEKLVGSSGKEFGYEATVTTDTGETSKARSTDWFLGTGSADHAIRKASAGLNDLDDDDD